jgi:hypothetical protein
MAIIKLSKNEQRRASVFVSCLLVAVLAWVLTELSASNPYKVKTVVNFTDLPQHRSFRSLQSDTVEAQIEGTGWNLLFSSLNMDNKTIQVSLKNLDTRSFVKLSAQIDAINSKRSADQKITRFEPDTLYFDFTSRAVKRVPVQLLYNIGFKKQFGIADDIVLKPNYVTVSGPAADLEKIRSWKTDSLSLRNVETNVEQTVHLAGVKESNISIYPRSVQVKVPVDEFTEKTVQIPVKLINNKNYYNVKVFPQKVKVTFLVSLGKYAEMDDTFFEAVADLNQWTEKGYEELPVKLTSFPDFCKIVNIEPKNIDFIVKK